MNDGLKEGTSFTGDARFLQLGVQDPLGHGHISARRGAYQDQIFLDEVLIVDREVLEVRRAVCLLPAWKTGPSQHIVDLTFIGME